MEAGDKKTVLVVDDNEMVLDALREHLGILGYTVISASDGEKAVDILETEKVDLVLTDLILPNMHGISLLKIAKGLSPDRPVVVMTGYGERLAREAMNTGADSYLLKPFSLAEVQKIMSQLL